MLKLRLAQNDPNLDSSVKRMASAADKRFHRRRKRTHSIRLTFQKFYFGCALTVLLSERVRVCASTLGLLLQLLSLFELRSERSFFLTFSALHFRNFAILNQIRPIKTFEISLCQLAGFWTDY